MKVKVSVEARARSHLILVVRDVNDAHKNVLVFLQPVRLEEPDHQLGDERDCDERQQHGNGTEGKQLSSKWPSVLQCCLINLERNPDEI